MVPLTQSKVRKKLRALVLSLGLDPEIIPFIPFVGLGRPFPIIMVLLWILSRSKEHGPLMQYGPI